MVDTPQQTDPFEAELARRNDPFERELARRQQQQQGPSSAEALTEGGEHLVRGFNQGLVGLATLPYRAVDWVGEKLTGGDFLPNVEEMSMYKPFLKQPEAHTTLGKLAHASGEVAGSSALPSATLLGKAEKLSKLAPTTTTRALGQSIGESIAANPGKAVAADALASVGAGSAQEGAKEAGFGPTGQAIAGMAGAVVPMSAAATYGRARDLYRNARANASPYEGMNKGLGDTTIDEFANSIAVGPTNVDLGNSRFALDVLGEEMVKAGGDRTVAIPSALRRIEQYTLPESADRVRNRMVAALRKGENPFAPGTMPEEIDNFIRVAVNGERPPAGDLPFPTIANQIEQEAQRLVPETAKNWLKRVIDAHRDSNLLFGEYPAVAQSNLATRGRNAANIPDETAGAMQETGTQQLLDYVANSGTMASSQNVRNAIAARARGLKDSTEDVVRGLSPEGRTIQDVGEMADAATRLASQEYKVVHGAPGMTDNAELASGLQFVVNKYLDRAALRGGEESQAIKAALEEFFTTLPSGQKIIMPTLQMAQDMRGALRGIIKRARVAGDDNIVNAISPIYTDVTKVMTTASPNWGVVNRKWADLELEEVASKLGDAFATKAGPKFREQMEQFRQLAPEAQDIVRVHFTQHLLDAIENAAKLGGGRNLAEVFTKEHTRNMIRALLGDDAALQIVRRIRDLNVAARSQNMMRGSTTHLRGQVQEEQDAPMKMVEAANNFDWRNWREALLQRALAVWRESRNKTMGRALTTPMRDVPRVAEQLEMMKRARAETERYRAPPPRPPLATTGTAGQFGNLVSAYDQDYLDDQGRLNLTVRPPRKP